MKAYPWLAPVFEKIYQDAMAERLSHALLVSGPQGIGVEEFSLETAHFRLCSNPSPEGACGRCKSCQLLQAHTHPDLVILEPEGAAQIIKVDQIRSLVGFVAQTPQIGQWKVILLMQAHRMNPSAANALLKILEEPSGNSLIILATERPQMLLPTVRSRCSHFRLPSASEAQAQVFLESNGIDVNTAANLVEQLGPRPTKILQWVNDDRLSAWQQSITLLDQVESGQSPVTTAAQLLKDMDLSQLLDWMMEYACKRIRESALSGSSQQGAYQLFYSSLLSCKQEQDVGSNPNPQLLLETLLADWRAALSH